MRTPETILQECGRCGAEFHEIIDCACSCGFHYEGGCLANISYGAAYDKALKWEKQKDLEDIRHDSKVVFLCDDCLRDFWLEYMTAKHAPTPSCIAKAYRAGEE